MEEDRYVDIIYLVAGIGAIIFRSWLAEHIIDFQNTIWRFNFGDREIKAGKFVAIIVGLSAIALGLLSIFQIIELKN